ncbi:MAG: SusC/RagA family TonB-linked outer membrane protein [Mucilaginibacter sp.]|nr:SusC/RagA family TonB-linked outer membrane protein [Mucilaginibacter sp.]
MYKFYNNKWVRPPGRTFSAVLLLTLFFLLTTGAVAQKITLSEKNTLLKDVFEKISRQTGFDFLVSTDNLNLAKPVTINVQNEEIKPVLVKIFTGQPLSFIIQEKMVVVSKKEVPARKVNTPIHVKVAGRVTDTTGTPLIGATITNLAGHSTYPSDDNGVFDVIAQVGDKLTVTYIGFRSYTFVVADDLPFQTIVLHADHAKLEQVIVVSTGYQSLPKERATGSFATVNNELLNRRVSPNIIDRLEGVVPGLIFNHNTAASVTGSDISIRGHSTLFANDQPLVVVDNFPYDGDINSINPNDVENITVLKDAAAASIWGVKSGNGVIVITTKHGTRGSKMIVELNSNVTIGDKPNLFYGNNFLDANDFINVEKSLFAQGYYTNDLTSTSHPVVSPVVAILASNLSQSQKDNQIDALRHADYRNQLQKYFYRNSINQQHSVSLRGGGVTDDYFLSAGYDDALRNQTGNGNNRFTLNSAYNFSLNSDLDFSLGFNFIQTSGQANSPVGNLTSSKSLYPYAQFADGDGNPLPIAKDYATLYTDAAINNGLLDWSFRPLDELHNADNTFKTTDNRVNAGVRYKAFQNLSLDLKYQYEKSSSQTEYYSGLLSYAARNLINQFTQINPGGAFSYPIPIGGTDDRLYQYLTSQRLRAQVNYNKNWGYSDFNVIGGAEISDVTTENNGNTVYGFDQSTGAFTNVNFSDYFQTNPSGSYAQIPSAIRFQRLSDRYLSYFGNGAYTYKKRYGVSLSGRIDKSNLFGVNTNQKSVPLYSAGGSWRFSDECFYHLSWLPYAKLRLTYGFNGNVDKNVTAVTTIQQQLNSYITGGPYAAIANPGNPELRWEKVSILNLGFDFSLKNNVISGSIEYYVKKGIDLFGDSPLPGSTGFTSFRGNTANTGGSGLDIVINSTNIQKGDLKWATGFMLSYVTDKVIHYGVPVDAASALIYGAGNNGVILPLVGKPLFGIYSYKWAGLDPVNGNPRGYFQGKPSDNYAAIMANTPLDSLKFNGTSRPKFFGSLRNTVSYKNISFSANIIYKLDYFFRRNSISYSSLYQFWQGNSDYSKRWQKPGDELVTNVPSQPILPLNGSRDAFYLSSSSLVTPGDHIRLQDISLSYDFNSSFKRKTPFRQLKVYCYLNNIGILWKANKQGLDPDLFSSGLPLPRTLSLGIKTQL